MAILHRSQKMLADTEAEILLLSSNAGDTAQALDTGLTYRFNGSVWLPLDGVRIIRSSNNLDCKTIGNTATLMTTPNTVFRFMPLAAHIEAISITGTVGLAPSISGGTNASTYNNVFTSSALATLLTGGTQPNALVIGSTITPLSGNTSLTARCNIAATLYTTYVVRVDIMGTYVQ